MQSFYVCVSCSLALLAAHLLALPPRPPHSALAVSLLTQSPATARRLWDVADDAFFAKQNPSCPYLHWESQPALSPAIWTLIWLVTSFLLFVGFVLAAFATWKQSPHAMYCQAQTFLPCVPSCRAPVSRSSP